MSTKQSEQGQGHGFATIGDACALANISTATASPLVVVQPDNFLASPHTFGDGLLGACAAQFDLREAARLTRKLAAKMAEQGREDARHVVGDAFDAVTRSEDGKRILDRRPSRWPTQWVDAMLAGVGAVQSWRNRAPGAADAMQYPSAVAWRAIVDAISADATGDGDQVLSLSDDSLWARAATLSDASQRDDDATRRERAAQLWAERATKQTTLAHDYAVNIGDAAARVAADKAAADDTGRKLIIPAHAPGAVVVVPAGTVVSGRLFRLGKRLANLPPGRGKRAELIERIGRACAFLLQGETIDAAATRAGFKGNLRGRMTPGDRFAEGMRRVGFRFVFSSRQDNGAERGLYGEAIGDLLPAVPGALVAQPDADADVATVATVGNRGRAVVRDVVRVGRRRGRKLSVRLDTWRKRQAATTARQAAAAARVARDRQADRVAKSRNRWLRRQVAKLGLWEATKRGALGGFAEFIADAYGV